LNRNTSAPQIIEQATAFGVLKSQMTLCSELEFLRPPICFHDPGRPVTAAAEQQVAQFVRD
jgi:hypothetical protein